MNIENTLQQRRNRYGEFKQHADIAQDLKDSMRSVPSWDALATDMKEALEMIQHKVARILNGDPRYADNWHDIAGYATLVDKRLNDEAIVAGLNKSLAGEQTLFSGQQGV